MAQPTYTLEELSRKVDAISEFLNEKTDRDLLNLDSVGQLIIDKKVEVEALLAQNGYAKFSWNDGNKIAKLIVQWGQLSIAINKTITVTMPTSFSSTIYHPFTNQRNHQSLDGVGDTIGSIPATVSTLQVWHGWYGENSTATVDWLAVGY